jgi:hypothetical protein
MPRHVPRTPRPLTIAQQLHEWRSTNGTMPDSGGVIARQPFERQRRTNPPQQGSQRTTGSPNYSPSLGSSKSSPQRPAAAQAEHVSWSRLTSERTALEKANSLTGGKQLPTLAEALRAAPMALSIGAHNEIAVPAQAPPSQVPRHPVPARVRMSFDAVDRDKSGFLEANELEAAFTRYGINLNSRAGLERVVQAAGGDGRLDFDEYATLIGELETERRVTNQLKALELAVTPRMPGAPTVLYGM